MATRFPYTASTKSIVQCIAQFRKSFPPSVDAETLRKLGIAPQNESYLINILRFLGILSSEGKKTKEAAQLFTTHQDEAFAKSLSEFVKKSYVELFELHGDAAWNLPLVDLITFFRQSDQTSEVVGKRQAAVFETLGELSGKRSTEKPKNPSPAKGKATASPKVKSKAATAAKQNLEQGEKLSDVKSPPVGLTVRIEINLPAQGDQSTYDRIFKSIRDNFLKND